MEIFDYMSSNLGDAYVSFSKHVFQHDALSMFLFSPNENGFDKNMGMTIVFLAVDCYHAKIRVKDMFYKYIKHASKLDKMRPSENRMEVARKIAYSDIDEIKVNIVPDNFVFSTNAWASNSRII